MLPMTLGLFIIWLTHGMSSLVEGCVYWGILSSPTRGPGESLYLLDKVAAVGADVTTDGRVLPLLCGVVLLLGLFGFLCVAEVPVFWGSDGSR